MSEDKSRRPLRIWRGAAAVVTGIAILVGVLLVSARQTVLEGSFYDHSLEEARAYDRFYTQILSDPEFETTRQSLVAHLPLEESVLTSNLRVVIPPATLRVLVGETITAVTEYLTAERDEIDLTVAAKPLIDNVGSLAEVYLTDAVVNTPTFESDNVGDFGQSVKKFLADVGSGRKPTLLPTVPISPETTQPIVDSIVQYLPPDRRDVVRDQMQALVATGDLNGALALAAQAKFTTNENSSATELTVELGRDGTIDFTASADSIENSSAARTMKRARFFLGDVYPFVLLGDFLIVALGLAAVAWSSRRLGRRPARAVGLVIVASAGAVLLVWGVLRILSPDPLAPVVGSSNRAMAPSVRRVLGDVWDDARGVIDATVVGNAVWIAIVGGLVLLAARLAPTFTRWWHTDRKRFWVVSAAVVVFVVGFFTVNVTVRVEVAEGSSRLCNGHAELCDRAYDDVTYAGSHNAMASADRRYLSAMQDLTMSDQLEQGVRALLIDAHHWETPEEKAGFLDSLPADTANALRPLLAGANPVRPGAWLCHNMCRLGYEPLAKGFGEIARFVRTHPDEVITLIVEDYVSRDEIEDAVRRAGLTRFMFTPGNERDYEWPTLGEMIDDNKRVVILAEHDDALAQPDWYRNYYRYGMETPYDHPEPENMSCQPNRGGTGKRLFLMNHWITRATGSRADAGVVNRKRFIVERARRCARERGHRVNIVAVDFTTIGDVFDAVDELNGVAS